MGLLAPMSMPIAASTTSPSPLAANTRSGFQRSGFPARSPATPLSPGWAVSKATTSMAIPSPRAPSAPASSTGPDTSDLQLDDLAHPYRTHHDKNSGADQHDQAERRGVQRANVIWL